MKTEVLPYAHRKHLIIAGSLALMALLTACLYEWRSTPYTMVVFLMGGWTLFLSAVGLFGWAIWKDLRARLKSVVSKSFATGDVIYRQGDLAEHIFFVSRGQVEIVHDDSIRGNTVLGRINVDEYFGETAILSHSPRQATARAVDAVEVLVIHRTHFLKIYDSLPRLRARIDRQHAQRRGLFSQLGQR
jgi:signal-transduction protein with cAMP-binding, CBS, and nucleotidyltransferase domain